MSDSEEGGPTNVIHNWIYEYIRADAWNVLKNYSSDTVPNVEPILGTLLKAQHDDNRGDDVFLAQWMYNIWNGRDLSSSADNSVTRLEEAFGYLSLLRERFKSLDHKKCAKVERLLMEQAVTVCMEKREFTLARYVKCRLWQGDLSPSIKKLGDWLDKAIAKGSQPKDMSSFQDLIIASVDLLEDLCQNQLAQPCLIKIANDEVRKRKLKKTRENQVISIKTGIKLTGPLLNSFVARHALVPEEGGGFLPPDKFQSALDELQTRKDELLKNIPECLLSVLTTAVTPSAATPSAATPSAVNPSAVNPSAVNPSAAASSEVSPFGSSGRKRLFRQRTLARRGMKSRSTRSPGRLDSESDGSTDRDSEGDVHSLRDRLGVGDDTFVGVQAVAKPQFRKNPAVMARRIPRSKWTEKEEDLLFEGVKRFGVGTWAQIVETGVLPGRSNVDLKDKWRCMVKKEKRARKLQRLFDSQPAVSDGE